MMPTLARRSAPATISSNLLVGVVHPNVDVEFDPLGGLGIVEAIDAETGSFDFDGVVGETYTTTIHLADNTMVPAGGQPRARIFVLPSSAWVPMP